MTVLVGLILSWKARSKAAGRCSLPKAKHTDAAARGQAMQAFRSQTRKKAGMAGQQRLSCFKKADVEVFLERGGDLEEVAEYEGIPASSLESWIRE